MKNSVSKCDLWKPGYHIMPPSGWLNDPNGLCFFNGYYHVFYQYAPDSPEGGLKCWGHYRSRDLLNWEECPVMMKPDQPYDRNGVYSGSALIENDKMYLFYTGNVKHKGDYDYINSGREHNTVMAVSTDGMKIDKKLPLLYNRDYPEGLTCHVRDPKVFKYDGKYYMVIGARTKQNRGQVLVYESEDLSGWKFINTLSTKEQFGYMWECPDLFELDGSFILAVSPQGLKSERQRYQNVYSSGYFIINGDFRGGCTLGNYTEFDSGFDFYAPQTFEHDGRRLMLAWMGMPDAQYTNPTVKYGWQHCMSMFRELNLKHGRIVQVPAREYKKLRKGHKVLRSEGMLSFETENPCLEINISDIDIGNNAGFGINIFDTLELIYDVPSGEFVLIHTDKNKSAYGRTKRVLPLQKNELKKIDIFLDASCAEIFVNDTSGVLSTRYYPENYKEINCKGSFNMEIYEISA